MHRSRGQAKKDPRSDAAKEWRRLYGTKAWRQARQEQLYETPLCERCSCLGTVVAASVVNHRTPHRGDLDLFFDPENHESLCKPCHDGERQSQERTGRDYDSAVGADGMPVDPGHPWYGGS